MSNPSDRHLIWIDLEMTGLEPNTDKIIEIATVVTDSELQTVAEGPVIAIHQEEQTLAAMDAWNASHHRASGLIQRVRDSPFTVAQAEQQTLDFLKQYVVAGSSPMCGNSICQDRRFLYKYMPQLAEFFHYRNLDVSALKILAERWAPEVAKGLAKQSQHLALSDIYDSIEELCYYRKNMLSI